MLDEAILEQILIDKETRTVPIGAQSTMIHVMERILEENGIRIDANRDKGGNL